MRPASPGNRPYHPTVVREGRNGLKRTSFRIKIVDGREVERVSTGETIVREPVSEIVISRKPHPLGSRAGDAGILNDYVVATADHPAAGKLSRHRGRPHVQRQTRRYGIIAV